MITPGMLETLSIMEGQLQGLYTMLEDEIADEDRELARHIRQAQLRIRAVRRSIKKRLPKS